MSGQRHYGAVYHLPSFQGGDVVRPLCHSRRPGFDPGDRVSFNWRAVGCPRCLALRPAPAAVPEIEAKRSVVTMTTVAGEIAARHKLTLEDLTEHTRRARIAHARQEAMVALRGLRRDDGKPRYSRYQVARFFGLKDPTTVLHAEKVVPARLEAAE